MIDAFPFRSWLTQAGEVNQEITAFWPYGPGGTTGTWTLTVIGMIITFLSIVGWMYMDDKMLNEHAERLRAAGFGRPTPPGGATTHRGS